MATDMVSHFESFHRYHHSDFSLSLLASTVKASNLKTTVIIPAKEVASTIAKVLDITVKPFTIAGIVSSVIVVDAKSADNTGEIATTHGATVVQREAQGKGDAMYHALSITTGDIIAFLDGDTTDPSPLHLLGILGPLIMDDSIQMVKGYFDRPFKSPTGEIYPNQGGRVTELMARPILNLHYPELGCFAQPLAGEFAARRSLLERLPFPVGYGIEIGSLIDAWRMVGLDGLAETDLGTRQNRHQSLRELGMMASAVLNTVERRLDRGTARKREEGMMWLPWKGSYQKVSCAERPPLVDLSATGTPSASHSSPFIDVPGVLNFRDIGGNVTSSGVPVRRNLVYRSAKLSNLTKEAVVQLQSMGINKILDLRSSAEIVTEKETTEHENWLRSPNAPEKTSIPIFRDEDHSPVATAIRFKAYAGEGIESPVKVNRSILDKAGPAIHAVLSHLGSHNPTPILIHCTAGKDRTGMVVMVLLLLAGCSADTVAQEYHLTEQGLGDIWKSETVERLLQHPVFAGGDKEAVERMVGAREDVMIAVIEMVEKEWGGVEGYLKQVVGADGVLIERCKKALIGAEGWLPLT